MCPEKMKDRFISLYDASGKKQLQTGTCVIWLCGTVAFEGQITMKVLALSAKVPFRRTNDESSSATPSLDLAQMLCLPTEILKDVQAQMKSSQIPPDLPRLNPDVCHLGRACSPLLGTWPSLLHTIWIIRFRSISSCTCHPSLMKEQINATDKVWGIKEHTGELNK